MKKVHWMALSIVITILCLIAVLFSSLSPLSVRTPEKFRLGVAMTPMSLLVFAAQDKGFFKKQGLDLSFTEYGAGVLAADGLLKGEVEVATAAEFLLVRHNLAGKDLSTIASVSRITDCELIARKDAGISTISDLKGRRIATTSGTALEFFLEYFLTTHGIPVSGVFLENLKPSETVEALVSGAVDAMVAFSPYTFQARQKLGDRVLSWPLQEKHSYYFLILSTSEFLQARPRAAERILAALLEAETFVSEHRAEAQSILMRRLNLNEAYASSIWSRQTFDVRLDQHLLRLMEDQTKWLLKRKGEQGIPNYLKYIDWQPLEKIKPDAVGLIH